MQPKSDAVSEEALGATQSSVKLDSIVEYKAAGA
jgi:hypothetical protein